MALPRINETLNFNMTIPSTGERVQYRPYLVKEEKVLLQAFESKDTEMCLQAMSDTISSCLDPNSNVDVSNLATFDIEYMFTQLRAKSVGETSTIMIRCKNQECKEANEYHIDLETLNVEVPKNNNIIKITKDISVELCYPKYSTLVTGEVENAEKDMDAALKLLSSCIVAVLTTEERIDARDQSEEELIEFLQSMTATQLKGLTSFLENIPALKHDAKFNCEKCGTENELQLKGLSDFF